MTKNTPKKEEPKPTYIKEAPELTIRNTPKPVNGKKRELPSEIKRKNFIGPTSLGRPANCKKISKICEPVIAGTMTFADGTVSYLYEHGSVRYTKH